jgi:prevent-host-death family protein
MGVSSNAPAPVKATRRRAARAPAPTPEITGQVRAPNSRVANQIKPLEPGAHTGATVHLATLPKKASSLLKKEGWSAFMREVHAKGGLIVTHRGQPEAVVISAHEFDLLTRMARKEGERQARILADLNVSFDKRLAGLQAPDALDRMDRFMDEPIDLGGKVRAGQGY